jgi:hypothetical protein
MDYAAIEGQARDAIQADVPEVTTWSRDWLNAGRRELQRAYTFPELLAFFPDDEADLGTEFTLDGTTRRIEMPPLWKEFATRRADLWRVEPNGDLVPLERRTIEQILDRYNLSDIGTPECFHVIRQSDGTTTYLEVFPKPDVATGLRLYGYFYLPDLPAAPASLTGVRDFLSELDPLLVRDFVVREAFNALEQWDSAARLGEAIAGRARALIADAKLRELETDMVLPVSLRSAERGPSSRSGHGYPWWGR